MKKIILLNLFLSIQTLSLSAQYKNQVLFPDLNGNSLINAIFNNYKTKTVLNYTDARVKMYSEIYNVHDSVQCVYSHYSLYLDPSYPYPIDYLAKSGSANGINCEHSFPQSKGADMGNARSDMHHLFPVRAAVNEARSNYPYAEIDDAKTKTWFYLNNELSSKPKTQIDEYAESISGFFEPREDHKGNAARAIFYFYTMYEIQADQSFFELMKPTLCQWHLKDPVDSAEWNRTFAIAKYQDNKPNPFVLDCSLAKRCYCESNSDCIITSLQNTNQTTFSFGPNPISDHLNITIKDEKISSVIIFSGMMNPVYSSTHPMQSNDGDINISTIDWPASWYLLEVKLENQTVLRRAFIKL